MPEGRMASANFLPAEGMTVGHSELLVEFLELCGAFQTGSFFFTAPFFDDCFLDNLLAYVSVPHTTFEIVVRNPAAASEILGYFERRGCRSVSVRLSDVLHAKVYIFESARKDLFGLVGSHNPTAAAMKTNLEVGIYIGAKVGTPEWRALFELREFLRTNSLPYIGTESVSEPRKEREHDYRSSVN